MPPPALKILVDQRTREYSLVGFDEFDRWMLQNVPAYAEGCLHAARLAMRESDRIKMLLWMVSTKAHADQSNIINQLRDSLVPPAPQS